MRTINCNVIKDVLPLYVDDVVSMETKEMVEDHLQHCESCQKEAEQMKQELVLPIEKQAPLFKKIKKKWRHKKLMISSLSVLLTGVILFGAFFFVFHYDTVIPYSESLIQIETEDNERLVSHYFGESYYAVHVAGPFSVEVDGKQKNTVFLHYTETLADAHDRRLFQGDDASNESTFSFPIARQDEVDVVYYADFDTRKVLKQENYWETVTKRADLIWEKPRD